MSHGHNGRPAAPDWYINPALERCIGCNKARVGCEADVYHGSHCCGFCSHGFLSVEVKLTPTLVWDGDDS